MVAQLRLERAGQLRQGFEGKLQHWDVNYWAERLREARYQLTDEQLRPYFALPNVLDGLFQARARRPSSGATLKTGIGMCPVWGLAK
jgi:oligopeptidase A